MPFDPEAVREFERAGWNRAAGSYAATFAVATRQFIDPLLDAGAVVPGTDVLDLCCGPGFVADAAFGRGARVTGMDFSIGMLDQARTRFPAITFDQGDAEAPPYAAATFDSVVSNFGIHHVPRPDLAIAAVHRILRPGGHFAASVWADHDENVAWKLVFDAVARFGDPRASAAPPPGGGFAADDCLRALGAAGFVETGVRLSRGVWRHPDAASLLGALRAGTARMAAIIEAQTVTAMPAIVAGVEAAAAPWRDGDGLAVPIASVIIAGTRP
jgi:SAM-dependent methyltransferase